ncbi:hypothetical protein ACP4OV_010378 [Aristida adscensionis]
MPVHVLHALIGLAAAVAAATIPIAGAPPPPPSSNCQRRCGSVDIPYPFGIGSEDSPNGCAAPGFYLSCQDMGGDIFKPFIFNVEVIEILLQQAQARMRMTISHYCYNTSTHTMNEQNSQWHNLTTTPYRFSDTGNKLTVVGCRTLAYIGDQDDVGRYMSGCLAMCRQKDDVMAISDGSCAGIGCCQTTIPKGLNYYRVWFSTGIYSNISICSYAALVETSKFTFHKDYATTPSTFYDSYGGQTPVLVDWALGGNRTCEEAQKNPEDFACVSSNSECLNSSNGPGYICHCSNGFQGNPYVVGGCQDINECERLDEYPCRGVCWNTPGSYKCKCPSGSHSSDPFKETCNPNFPLGAQVAIGALGGLFIIVVLVSILLVRKARREMYECFKRNGGQILEEVGNIKLFRKEELRPILIVRNLIGQGGFGQVYKGHIGDISQPVAVKKPKITAVKKTKDLAVTESKKDGSSQKNQFANEVIIQSRISHQNIVKLIGCCLEVEMPILVYEFITQGSLDDILHGSSRRALDICQRLDIAMQSADGLAYMHTQKPPVLHGDVKPSNILLHDGFVPKISDFGISRLITLDKQYTMNVIGDLSYVDPVYLQSGLLTNKSDVYSFGIVLLEIITRKQASDSDNYILFRNFDACTKEKRVIELVDPEIGITENIELLESLAGMILKCLNLNVDQRPEMSDLAEFLRDMLKRSQCNKNNIV